MAKGKGSREGDGTPGALAYSHYPQRSTWNSSDIGGISSYNGTSSTIVSASSTLFIFQHVD